MNWTSFGKQQISIERMTRAEVEIAIEWAKKEGWNPGVHDAEHFFNTDPKGFYCARVAGEVVATVSIVKYSKDFAFEGLLIVRPDFRGKGIGLIIQEFVNNICRDVNLGLDGVLPMKEKYERVGFAFAHNNTRYTGIISGERSSHCLPICKEDFSQIVSFDAQFFPATRPTFLECFLFQKDATAFMVQGNRANEICGYGVIRKCVTGHKIGPLFANDKNTAELLLKSLASTVFNEEIFLDVPEPNKSAVQLAERNGMRPVFSTVRMYTKLEPSLPLDKIYGITSFELG